MANFSTHVGVAAAVAAVTVPAMLFAGWVTPPVALSLFCLVVIGTMLPDVDVDHARPVRWLFTLLATVAAALMVTIALPAMPGSWPLPYLAPHPDWEIALAAVVVFLLVRFPVAWGFQKLTAHRGVWHSLLLGWLLSIGWVAFAYQVLALSVRVAWLQGCALMFGFIIHLLLDEFYSIDFEGTRLKRSFGTAFKLGMKGQPFVNLALLGAIVAIMLWLPSPTSMLQLFVQH